MTSRSAFIGDGWNAEVEVIDGVVTIDLLLVGIGVSGRAQLFLPVGDSGEGLATLVEALYADQLLLAEAVRVHFAQHGLAPRRTTCKQVEEPTAHTTRTTRTRSSACTTRRRR